MAVSEGREQGYDYPGLGVGLFAGVNQSEIIPHEIVPIIGPGARVGVINSQMDDIDVSGEVHRFREYILVEIWPERTLDKRRPVPAEIADLIIISEHHLKLGRVGIIYSVLYRRTVGDAVTDAGDFNFPRRRRIYGTN